MTGKKGLKMKLVWWTLGFVLVVSSVTVLQDRESGRSLSLMGSIAPTTIVSSDDPQKFVRGYFERQPVVAPPGTVVLDVSQHHVQKSPVSTASVGVSLDPEDALRWMREKWGRSILIGVDMDPDDPSSFRPVSATPVSIGDDIDPDDYYQGWLRDPKISPVTIGEDVDPDHFDSWSMMRGKSSVTIGEEIVTQ